MGAVVQSACVHRRRDHVYFADLRLVCGQDEVKIDVRPSDALVVALHANVPFLFTETLLAECASTELESG